MLGALDQKPARVLIAALGNRSLVPGIAGALFAADQAKVSHELARMSKAAQVAQFGQKHGRGDDLDAAQGHERFHGRFHPPSGDVQFNLPV